MSEVLPGLHLLPCSRCRFSLLPEVEAAARDIVVAVVVAELSISPITKYSQILHIPLLLEMVVQERQVSAPLVVAAPETIRALPVHLESDRLSLMVAVVAVVVTMQQML
jgi:hypothetical protein